MTRVLLLAGASLLPLRHGGVLAAAPEVHATSPTAALDPGQIDELLRQAHDLEGNDTNLALQKTRDALAGTPDTAALRPRRLQGLLQLGRLLRLLNDYPNALRAAEDGMTLARELGDQHTLGELFLLRGFVEWNQAKVPEATVSMMEAARLGDGLDDNALRVGALYGRGIVRGRTDDLQGAFTLLREALRLAETTHDARLGPVLNSLGVVHLQLKDYPQAQEHFERALAILKDGTNQRTTAYALLNLGQIATETGNQDAAARYLDASAALCERFDFRRGLADIAYLRGARARRLGKLDEAKGFLDGALGLANKLGNPDLFVSIYEEYIQTEQTRGDYRAALDNTRKLAEKLEAVRGEKSRRQASEIQARYEAEHHARQIDRLKRARDLQQADLAIKGAELGTSRWIVVSLVLGAVTLAALASRQRAHARLSARLLAETRAAKAVVERADAHKTELLHTATRDLHESEERFRSAFEHSALGLALVGLDGRWLRVNQALCLIVGYTEAELRARDFQSITHPDDLAADLALAARLVAREIDSYTLEKRYLHKEGHLVWIRLDVTLMLEPINDAPGYFISQVHDITERRRAQEQLRAAKEEAEGANRAKNAFLSRMSHELRTPLNAILGFGQLLEGEDLGERQNQSVAHITDAGRHLLELINEVLDIAQIESGQFSHQSEAINAEEAVRSAVNLMEPLARDAGIELRLETPADAAPAPAFIRADPRRLRQVVLNLLSNAIKYNHPGGEVVVRCVPREGRVRVEVADTGAGISTADIERIFSPFTRLSATESVHGSGLGLSVSRSLTEAMGGMLTVVSTPGQGSTFALEFARLSAEEIEQGRTLAVQDISPEIFAALQPETSVLYIEDQPDNRELVRQILAQMDGMRFASANNGQDGLALARRERPDLVLLDLKLPDMTGVEVLRQLRAQPALADVPVIVMSADATMQHLDELRALGVVEYLTNPFDLKEFCRVVETVVAVR